MIDGYTHWSPAGSSVLAWALSAVAREVHVPSHGCMRGFLVMGSVYSRLFDTAGGTVHEGRDGRHCLTSVLPCFIRSPNALVRQRIVGRSVGIVRCLRRVAIMPTTAQVSPLIEPHIVYAGTSRAYSSEGLVRMARPRPHQKVRKCLSGMMNRLIHLISALNPKMQEHPWKFVRITYLITRHRYCPCSPAEFAVSLPSSR